MFECSGRDCNNTPRQNLWEPVVAILKDDVQKLSRKLEAVQECVQVEVQKLSQKLEVVQECMQKLEESNGGKEVELFKKTQDMAEIQISQMHRVSELEAASAETAKRLPLLATSVNLLTKHAYSSEETSRGVRSPQNLPEGCTQQQEKIDVRLSSLEEEFSKFEQRLSTAEKASFQKPQLTQYSTKAEDLTTTIGKRQSPTHVFADQPVPHCESSLTEQLTQLSEKLNFLEQRINESRGWEQASRQEDTCVDIDGQPEKTSTTSDSAIHLGRELTEQLSELSERLQVVEQSVRDSQGDAQSEAQSDSQGDEILQTAKSEVASRHLQYEWRPSIWDLAVFTFSEQAKLAESLVVLACLMFTLLLLVTFAIEVTLLINDKYARFDDTSQQEYYFWRSTVAHDYSFRNKFTDESLASAVCNGKLYAPLSSLQLQTVLDLQGYLKKSKYGGLTTGSWMAALSVCVWYLVLLQEFRTILQLLQASLQLELGPHTRFERNRDDGDTYDIVTVSYLRGFLLGVLMILRILIVCILGWQGTFFLLSEVDLENMILNSVALQIMLTFDEMLYDLVPPLPQEVLKRMQPVRIPVRRCPKCWFQWGLFVLIFFGTAVIVFLVSFSHDKFIQDLRDSYDALCGGVDGSYDFVVAVDAIGIPWAAATAPLPDNVQETYVQSAMAAARSFSFQNRPLQSSQRANLGLFMQLASSQELEHAVSNLPEFEYPTEWSMVDQEQREEVVGWKSEFLVLGQQDFADEPDTVYNHYLQHLLKQTGNVRCAQVPVSSCTKPGRRAEHVVMRKLCPTHCGCASPTEGTVANTYGSSSRSDFTGCAVWNKKKKSFIDRLQDLPCADTGSRDDFVSWSGGVGDAVHNSGGMLIDHLVSTFDSGRCPDVVKITLNGWRICQETSLPSICPESCGCNTSGQEWTSSHINRYDFCPYSCYGSQPPCTTIVATHSEETARGPYAGFSCIFPFKYQGVTYHSCTSKSWTGPWCAVTLLDGVSHIWGDCPDTSACVNRST